MIPLVLAAMLVAVAAIIFYRHATTPARLMRMAERDGVVATDPAIRPHWRKLREMAIERLGRLEPGDRDDRLGMVELLCGTRFAEFEEERGDSDIPRMQLAIMVPDERLVDALVEAYATAVDQGRTDAGEDPGGLIQTKVAYGLDFRSLERYLHGGWERLGPESRGSLSVVFSILLGRAEGGQEGEIEENSAWYGMEPAERERMQAEMDGVLAVWAVPTMRAAATGQGVAAEDAGHFLYLLRAHRLEE